MLFPRVHRGKVPFFLVAFGLLALAACNRPAATPTVAPGAGLVYTAAAQTVEAGLTQVAAGTRPATTPTSRPPATSLPDATDSATAAPVPSATPEATSQRDAEGVCDRATFVRDVTVPDGMEVPPGGAFEKTWRLRNTGTCTWDSGYSLIFDSGDAMGGPASLGLVEGNVPPNEEVDVSVNLTAPLDPGTYRGNWMLRNSAGTTFGVGANSDEVFWVEIQVTSPTTTPDPDFSLAFENIHDCDGAPTAIFRVQNDGNLDFESARIVIELESDGTDLHGPEVANAPFMGGPSECPPGGSEAGPGTTLYLGAALAASPEPGVVLRASIELCSQDDRSGVCLEESITFPVP